MNNLFPCGEEFQPKVPKDISQLRESFDNRSPELPDELLVGAIDSHVHACPVLKSNPGFFDPIEAAIDARNAGMPAIMFYDVFGWASGTSWIVNRHVPGIRAFGGYLMNSCHGGMNPRAVKTALNLGDGCRFISFGSHCTYHSASQESTIIDGKLVPFWKAYPKFREEELSRAVRIGLEDPVSPELDEILSMVAERPEVYLNSGDVSPEEVMRLLELVKRYGIRKFLISHGARGGLTIEQQKYAASQGAFLEACAMDFAWTDVPHTHYYVEREYRDMSGMLSQRPACLSRPTHWMDTIREVGCEHFVLGTDFGIRALSTPVQGMRTIIANLLDYEFQPEEIRRMTATNPARLIGLEE